jgi:hypothetical protein
MAYNPDITEELPYILSNPSTAKTFDLTGIAYDISIDGKPFFLMTNDTTPHKRATAPFRKEQIDQSKEPGEQTLTGWWLRSQSSFHCGSGIKFYDPTAGESIDYRFTDSQGVNVWERGKVSLLKSTSRAHHTTTSVYSNGTSPIHMRSITWSGMNGALLHDGYDVDKVFPTLTYSVSNKALTTNVATLTTTATHALTVGMEIVVTGVDATFNGTFTVTAITTNTFSYALTAANVTSTAVTPVGTVTSNVINFIDYNSGSAFPVYAICDDGVNAYWVTNSVSGGGKLAMYKKPLTGSSASTADEVNMFTSASIVASNATMEWVKDRIVLCVNNVVYEVAPNATTLPAALYTNPNTNYTYTSVSASGPAIYTSGFSGLSSTIQKYTLSSAGAMPTLSQASVAAELPVGEKVYRIFYYLGYMMIGTSRGVRAAAVNDQDGSLNYGPLIVETPQPCYDFAARDKFIWCATSVNGDAGLIRIDLSQEIEQLRFAYANDLQFVGDATNRPTAAVAFMGSLSQLAFATIANGATDGYVYIEHLTNLRSDGYITTGKIRYATLEGKIFKFLKSRVDNSTGSIVASVIDSQNNSYAIGNYAEGDFVGEAGISYPIGAQEYLSFKFTLTCSKVNTANGAILNGYQVKALPALTKQRLIDYPLMCFDNEKDKYDVPVGYEGRAYDRILELEAVEDSSDSIRITDFRTNESFTGMIEQIQFVNTTPTDKRVSGYGGILYVQIRKL